MTTSQNITLDNTSISASQKHNNVQIIATQFGNTQSIIVQALNDDVYTNFPFLIPYA